MLKIAQNEEWPRFPTHMKLLHVSEAPRDEKPTRNLLGGLVAFLEVDPNAAPKSEAKNARSRPLLQQIKRLQ